jgi:hypothetical protein
VKNQKNTVLNLNISKDDQETNDFLYCWEKFSKRPSKIVVHNSYSGNSFLEIFEPKIQDTNVLIEVSPVEESFLIHEKVFAKLTNDIYCSYLVIEKNTPNCIVSEVKFFFSDKKFIDEIQTIINDLNNCQLDFCEEDVNNLNTLTNTQSGVEIEPIDSLVDLECFDMFYSKSTMKKINKLIKEVKKSKKGLSILYGERGTGKTSVISYLASKLDRIVIFIPNNLIENTINNSEFRKFLKRFDRPIIVIDDCEMIFSELFTKSNIFSNNLMQLVDGFLSDTVEVNIVSIFNVDNENEIDHSLLECNNLISTIEFDRLSADESTDLSDYLGFKRNIKKKSKVIDIVKNREFYELPKIGL